MSYELLLPLNQIYHGDCLELLKDVDEKSIDLILCDLPYGITGCKWDSIIPFEPLWKQYERVIKDRGAIVLTAGQPFTSALVMSNPKLFRYEWIWEKNINSNFQNAKNQPLKHHESVLVFYKKKGTYNPQGVVKLDNPLVQSNSNKNRRLNHISGVGESYVQTQTGYPRSIQKFNCERGFHATQKPVTLGEYFIKTYTNEGDIVFDNCCGSGSFLVAARNTNRNWIGIEKDEQIYRVAKDRLRH